MLLKKNKTKQKKPGIYAEKNTVKRIETPSNNQLTWSTFYNQK